MTLRGINQTWRTRHPLTKRTPPPGLHQHERQQQQRAHFQRPLLRVRVRRDRLDGVERGPARLRLRHLLRQLHLHAQLERGVDQDVLGRRVRAQRHLCQL